MRQESPNEDIAEMNTSKASLKHTTRRKARTFLQRTFIRWFEERRHAFDVPVHLGRRTDRTLRIVVEGAPPALDFVLQMDGPQVFVNLKGQSWDWILWGEICPKKVPGGYICTLDEEPCTVYLSRESIWRDHCFEPFLDWFNTVYATSTWLACYGDPEERGTWARLSAVAAQNENAEGAVAVFKLPQT
jgi:hypothetical protein